jgi:hypothetical protein
MKAGTGGRLPIDRTIHCASRIVPKLNNGPGSAFRIEGAAAR